MNSGIQSALEERGADELKLVIIEDSDCELKALAEVTVSDPENPDRTIVLQLAQDPEAKRETDRTFELQSSKGLRKMVTPDRYGAVALYLTLLEQHGIREDAAWEGLQHPDVDIDMEAYQDWRDSLSLSDRRVRLIDQAEERIEHGAINLEPYFEKGATFRSVGLSDGAERTATSIFSRIGSNPRRCYENAYTAVTGYDGSRDVTYVEGIALPKDPGRISAHAWIEIDGAVAEVTWPWHSPDPPKETVYFGVEVPLDELKERFEERPGKSNPIVPSMDVLNKMSQLSQSNN